MNAYRKFNLYFDINIALNLSQSSVKFQGHIGQKNCQLWHEMSVSGQWLQFEFTHGFEMMHKTNVV